MVSIRKTVFVNDYYYHIFNRGVEKRIIFLDKRDYLRFLSLLYYYQFQNIPLRYSQFYAKPIEKRNEIMANMEKSGKIIEVNAYCLMPNHFHLLIRQKVDKGITDFVSNVTNAYTKYFNTKYSRVGSLLQGVFKAVFIETEEQIIHLTRYIHLNPVVASIILAEDLDKYLWSSYPAYISASEDKLIQKLAFESYLKSEIDYKSFVLERITYMQQVEAIGHLTLDYEEEV